MEWMIGNEFKIEEKGICKTILDVNFSKLKKPHEMAFVVIIVDEFENVGNECKSKYLTLGKLGVEQQIKLGTAVTPIDCYLELLIRYMVLGEKSRCLIKTRSGSDVVIILKLVEILNDKKIFELPAKEMYELALQYKENGVTMFKEYTTFAADYFIRAAKCLQSYKPFDNLTLKNDGIAADDMNSLLTLVQTNLAACLLMQQRFEDVIFLTDFVELQSKPSEKGSYRRAMAYLNLKEYEKAHKTMVRVVNFKENKEFVKLQQRILDCWKTSNDQYKAVIQKMFN